MSKIKSVCLVIANNDILENRIKDKFSSFFIEHLTELSFEVAKITILPNIENVLANEVDVSSKQYDIVIIISDLTSGVSYRALAKAFSQDVYVNKTLERILKNNNIEYTPQEIVTPNFINILEGNFYPILHLQRIYLIQETCAESIFTDTLQNHLRNYIRTPIFEKIAVFHLNGNRISALENLNSNVSFEMERTNSSTFEITYKSEKLESLIEFENNLKNSVFIDDIFSGIKSSLIYKDPSHHIQHALQVIENCFKQYDPANVFLSFNGGKDCTVLLHLTLTVLDKYHPSKRNQLVCVYVESRYPFPEQEEFINQCQRYYNFKVIKYQLNLKAALQETLREYPHFKACLMGTRRTDPFSQSLNSFQMTDKGYPEIMRVSPLLDWHYCNIWDYLLYYNVPYCKLYDMGYTSLGNENNTAKNTNLVYFDVLDRTKKYLPAHKLLDEKEERTGRG